jgi:hypothetical protein
MQVESVRATLKGKIKGFKNAIKATQNSELEIMVKNRTTHTISFTIRELEEVLSTLEFFDEKDEEV